MPKFPSFADENINPFPNTPSPPIPPFKSSTSPNLSLSSKPKKSPLKIQIPSILSPIQSKNPRSDQNPITKVSLKRKRPLEIQIPFVLQEIKPDLIKFEELEDESVEECDEISIGFGVFCKKGRKKVMEDRHKVVLGFNGNPNQGFYGVFDGHGGEKAAEYSAERLHMNIMEKLEKCEDNVGKENAVKAGYLKTDEDFLNQGLSSGTCCVTCIVEEKHIIVSNVGDCRAVLCQGGTAEALTTDHRAEHEDERRRIEETGGYVEFHRGAWRIHGILSVSRSIGDMHLKDWVLAEPGTKILDLIPDMDFIILASDGLWEKVGNQEAVDTTMRICRLGPNKTESTYDPWKDDGFGCENISPPSKSRRISLVEKTKAPLQEIKQQSKRPNSNTFSTACKELINLAARRGSLDDITVMIIDLQHFRITR